MLLYSTVGDSKWRVISFAAREVTCWMLHGIVWSIVGTANKTKRPKSVGTCKNKKKIFLVTTSCVHRHAGTGSVRASGKDLCHDGSTPAPFSPTDGKCSESGFWFFFFHCAKRQATAFPSHRMWCLVCSGVHFPARYDRRRTNGATRSRAVKYRSSGTTIQ